MNNRRSDKQPDQDEYRHKDDKRDRANADSGQRGESISLAREKTHRLKTERKKKRDYAAHASADQSVDERFSQAPLRLHRSEGQIGFGQDHRKRLDKCVDKSTLLPVLPRQSATRRRSFGCRCCTYLWRRSTRRSGRKLRKKS